MNIISKDIKEFLDKYIHSVGHLELLMFLHSTRARMWSASELSQEMRTNISVTFERLKDLEDLVHTHSKNSLLYAITNSNEYHFNIIQDIAHLYSTHKYLLIEEIFLNRDSNIRKGLQLNPTIKENK